MIDSEVDFNVTQDELPSGLSFTHMTTKEVSYLDIMFYCIQSGFSIGFTTGNTDIYKTNMNVIYV